MLTVLTVSQTICIIPIFVFNQEQEACKREQAAKEKEWEKLNQMEQKNLELEATIAELERYVLSVIFSRGMFLYVM